MGKNETMLAAKSASPLWRPSQGRVLLFALLAAGCLSGGAAAQPPTAIPDHPGRVMLIKNTVTAVNHGNITGNYTVLRDLACEQFRRRNTASDLAQTFAGLRQRDLDLSPILLTEPQLTQSPRQDSYGRLQLVGYFPTRPKAVRFVLIFRPVDGGWMIDDVSLGVAAIESVVQQPARQPASQDRHPAFAPTIQRLPGYTGDSR
jgi:hypothetical protein